MAREKPPRPSKRILTTHTIKARCHKQRAFFLTANFTNYTNCGRRPSLIKFAGHSSGAKLTLVFFLLPLREIHKSGRFDCPGAGLGESDKSFLRYRWLRAMVFSSPAARNP